MLKYHLYLLLTWLSSISIDPLRLSWQTLSISDGILCLFCSKKWQSCVDSDLIRPSFWGPPLALIFGLLEALVHKWCARLPEYMSQPFVSLDVEITFSVRCLCYNCRHVTLLVDRGLSWEEATKRREQMTGKSDGFYSSKREHKGRKLYILAAQKEHAAHLFTISRQVNCISYLIVSLYWV